MELLFTTSDMLVSKAIRKITKEPMSHCAVRIGEFVIHSSFTGVRIIPYLVFIKKNRIVSKLHYRTEPLQVYRTLRKYYGRPYDFLALLFLGLRYIFPSLIGKQNLWQQTGMFLCTEFITKLLNEKEDSMITPYKLYLKLKKERGNI